MACILTDPMETTYLDWAATALPDSNIIHESFSVARQYFANPSSPHQSGVEAGKKLAEARIICASVLGCNPEQVIFTSCATEANNMILFSQHDLQAVSAR